MVIKKMEDEGEGKGQGTGGRDICPRKTKDYLWMERRQMWHIGR